MTNPRRVALRPNLDTLSPVAPVFAAGAFVLSRLLLSSAHGAHPETTLSAFDHARGLAVAELSSRNEPAPVRPFLDNRGDFRGAADLDRFTTFSLAPGVPASTINCDARETANLGHDRRGIASSFAAIVRREGLGPQSVRARGTGCLHGRDPRRGRCGRPKTTFHVPRRGSPAIASVLRSTNHATVVVVWLVG